MRRSSSRAASFALFLAAAEPIASFTGLGTSDGTNSFLGTHAYGVSGDGAVVTGAGHVDQYSQLIRWTQAGGLQGIGPTADNGRRTRGNAVSGDGATIVGFQSFPRQHPFRWTQAGGFEDLGDLPGGIVYGAAHAASFDGNTIAGVSSGAAGLEAFRWTPGGGIQGLGHFPGGEFSNFAYSISADGNVIAGAGFSASAPGVVPDAFRWTASDGMQPLGRLPGTNLGSAAYAVSDDGAVIVGQSGEAFRWTAAAGMRTLGDLPGGPRESRALGASADASVIVGYGTVGEEGHVPIHRAFVWDPAHGMRSIESVLQQSGVNLGGWTLEWATAVSDDGRVVVGWGRNPAQPFVEGWVALLPPPPITGDANLDGIVNLADFNSLAANFGTGDVWSEGDFNYDAVVNLADFNLLAANFGLSASAGADGIVDPHDWSALAAAIPEPTTALLTALIPTLLIRPRWRRGQLC